MEEIDVTVGKLEERVEQLAKTQDRIQSKLDWFQATLLVTLGGVIVNLLVLIVKR